MKNIDHIFKSSIYGITGEHLSDKYNNIEIVKKYIESGIKIIQYREKEESMKYKYRQCKKIREITAKAGVTFIVNDHVDLALIVKADGVHLGQQDLPAAAVRKIAGNNMLIGLSTHNPRQARQAVKKEVDYIGVGPIFATDTKNRDEVAGLEYLDYIVNKIEIPHVAIGGITEDNINIVREHGGRYIAIISDIIQSGNIKKKINRIKNKIEG